MRRNHKWTPPHPETKEQKCLRCNLHRKPDPCNGQVFAFYTEGTEPTRLKFTTLIPNCVPR